MEAPGKGRVSYFWLHFLEMRSRDTTETKTLGFMHVDLYLLVSMKPHKCDEHSEADVVRCTGKAFVCVPFQEIIAVTTRGHFIKTPQTQLCYS